MNKKGFCSSKVLGIKVLPFYLFTFLIFLGCSTTKKTEPEKTFAQQLFDRLDTLRSKGYMFGHQDDPFYGLTWDYQPDSSDSP